MSEIPKREWPQFLERLVREHRGWLATVEQDGRIAAREQPLLGIRANGSIDIHVGEGTVRIDAPCAVHVERTHGGAVQGLEIEGEAGGRVRLRFRVAEPPGELDGIAPTER